MAKNITTISLPEKIKKRAQRGSMKMFGRINLSGYLHVLINKDCDKNKIK